MSIETIQFHCPQSGTSYFPDVIDAIVSFISREPKDKYKVIVGSDSTVLGREPFASSIISVIIVWRIGRGATYFWTKAKPQMFYSLRDRIIREALESITLAQEVRSQLVERLGNRFLWDGNEIHVDMGEGGESRECIKEVTGLIRGYDFIPVMKPEAWCASTVADKYT